MFLRAWTSNGIETITQSIANKVAVFSSQFESFNYVLLETLYFEYPAFVWFDNQLVSEVNHLGLCRKIKYGYCPNDSDLQGLIVQNRHTALRFYWPEERSDQVQIQKLF